LTSTTRRPARYQVDLVVLMLGTNDLKSHLALLPAQIAKGVQLLVDDVTRMSVARAVDCDRSPRGRAVPETRVLLVAPPHLVGSATAHSWGFDEHAARKSRELAAHYADVTRQVGCAFLDASEVVTVPDDKHGGDGIHLSADNCATLGAAVAEAVRAIFAAEDAGRR
jgi:lysophospholipase L1-like esterase